MPTSQDKTLAIAQRQPTQDDAKRLRNMQDAWKVYNGDFPQPLKVEPNETDDNVTINRCAPIVDKGVSFLFGRAVKIEPVEETEWNAELLEAMAADEDEPDGDESPPPAAPGVDVASAGEAAPPAIPTAPKKKPSKKPPKLPTPIQDWINGFWGDDDDRMALLSNLAINGGVCGQGFLKLIPAGPGRKYPRVVVMDPQLVRVITAPDDCQCVLAYVIEYPAGNGVQTRQVITRIDPNNDAGEYGPNDPSDTWTIYNYRREAQQRGGLQIQQNWQQVGDAIAWPYPFAPIFDRQNLPNPSEHWGRPDLTGDIVKMNFSLNFIESNTSRIIKWHAHPKTYLAGSGASQVSVGVNEMIVFDSPDAKVGTIEMKSDLSSSRAFAADIRSDMDEQSRVPAVALGRLESLPKGNISGVALQLLFQPLIEKTTHKQRLYGQLIREITRAALVLGGLITVQEWEDYAIELHWQNLLPVDDLAAAQTAQALIAVGVSKDTVIQELGYDPETEATKTAARQAKGLDKTPTPALAMVPMPAVNPPANDDPNLDDMAA